MRKQKFLRQMLFALALLLLAVRPAYTSAATTSVTGGTNGPLCNSGGYFTPSSVTVTSGDTITFSVPANDPYTGGVQVNGFPQGSFVVPRGGSVTTSALTANVSFQGTWPNSPSCIKGSGTVTVQAASSPSPPPSNPPPSPTSTPQNTTPAASSTPSSKSTGSSTTTKTSTAQQPVAPETVVADTITVSGKKVTSMQNLTIAQSQPLVLSGTTVPNGKITLTIHSNPTTVTVQADVSGKWSYTVAGLQPGNHTVYATVTDPATNQISASSKLLAFTVATNSAASVTQGTSVPMKKSSSILMLVVLSLLALLIIAAIVWLLRKKRNNDVPLPPTIQM